ncbi:MAG: bifunctional 3-deoxy-7-phosphoheptulonate synthase/chorismate mutase type II [Rikenellaceae bacterium]|nr:bifunctional 3-deoxy-7-phosphoheptulonate synthase/chorismate mutase type II [Rikenellaceae bacterium]
MSSFTLGAKRPLIISGPCSAETREQTLDTCVRLAATGVVDVLRAGIWKPRTQPGTFEGIGLPGLAWLAEAKRLTGLPIATEVASKKHVESALEFGVDILWLGARTTVSPFAVQEVADAVKGTDVKILIKNPMNPDIALWAGAVSRFVNVGIPEENIGLIHRGFSYFGHSKYRNAPMWHMILEMRSRFPEMMMICDPSHICGCRDYLAEISQTAADLRYDGLIIESHICPDKAWSDAKQQLEPEALEQMVRNVNWRKATADCPEFQKSLNLYRDEIDQIDSELFELLGRRMDICEKIGTVKKENNVAILQSNRWGAIRDRILSQASKYNLSEEFLKTVLEAIHIESISRQNTIMNK